MDINRSQSTWLSWKHESRSLSAPHAALHVDQALEVHRCMIDGFGQRGGANGQYTNGIHGKNYSRRTLGNNGSSHHTEGHTLQVVVVVTELTLLIRLAISHQQSVL